MPAAAHTQLQPPAPVPMQPTAVPHAPTANDARRARARAAPAAVHRARFVPFQPRAISAVAFVPSPPESAEVQQPGSVPASARLAAVARDSGDIEIWWVGAHGAPGAWTLQKTIPGTKDAPVEALVWAYQTIPTDADVDDEMESEDEENGSDINMDSLSESTAEDEDENGKKMQQNGKSPVAATAARREAARQRAIAHLRSAPPRLFSAGLNGIITEWDLETLRPKKTLESNAGGVWSLAVNAHSTMLAAGCEDGSVRVFDVSSGDFSYARSLDKQDARVLSLAFAQSGEYIIAGTAKSSVLKYDLASGRVLARMTVDTIRVKGIGKEETCVWAVLALADDVIVSGDSLGTLSIWNAESATRIHAIREHKADILALTWHSADASQNRPLRVFSTGVDRKIVSYALVKTTSSNALAPNIKAKKWRAKSSVTETWIVGGEKRYHSHDVRTLAVSDPRAKHAYLASGGVDTTLVLAEHVADFPNVKPRRIQPFPQHIHSVAAFSGDKRVLAVRDETAVTIYRLADNGTDIPDHKVVEGSELSLDNDFSRVVEIKLATKTNLLHVAMDRFGRFVVTSDAEATRVFELCKVDRDMGDNSDDDERLDDDMDVQVKVRKRAMLPASNAASFAFPPETVTGSSAKLILALLNGTIGVYDLDARCQSVGTLREPNSNLVTHLSVSGCGRWLACADAWKRVFVYDLVNLREHASLPTLDTPVTTLRFHPTAGWFVVATASNVFYVYDVRARRFAEWTTHHMERGVPNRLKNRPDKILGITFPTDETSTSLKPRIILWGTEFMCVVDLAAPKAEPMVGATSAKRSRNGEMAQAESVKKRTGEGPRNDNFVFVFRYQPLLFVECFGTAEMVVVERPLLQILENVGEAFCAPKYAS